MKKSFFLLVILGMLIHTTAFAVVNVPCPDPFNPFNTRTPPVYIGPPPIGESSLQSILNSKFGTGSVNANSDAQSAGMWSVCSTDIATELLVEYAGNKNINVFGIWSCADSSGLNTVDIFLGPEGPSTKTLSWGSFGNLKVNGFDTGVQINPCLFGFFLRGAGGVTFYTLDQLNNGYYPQALAYNKPGTDTWAIAFEDRAYNVTDKDFNDMVVIIEHLGLPVSGQLPPPELVSPTNGDPCVVFKVTPPDPAPKLTWNPSSWNPFCEATSYNVQISTSPGFENILEEGEVPGTSYFINPALYQYDTLYYWRVMAKTTNPGTIDSEWSPTWSFRSQLAYGCPFEGAIGAMDPDNDGDGIDDNFEVGTLGTDGTKKTLFIRPKKENMAPGPCQPGQYEYWPGFIQLFPDPRPGFAYIPPLAQAGIEVVVIGAEGHIKYGQNKFDAFNYDPTKDTTIYPITGIAPPPIDILEIVYKRPDAYFGSTNQGHTFFSTTNGPTWSWDTKGYTAFDQVVPQYKTFGYYTPQVYPFPLEMYFTEGAYSSIAYGQAPIASNCKLATCDDSSPLNLSDESTPVDDTVEFNAISFDSNGKITGVGSEGTEYYRDDVLRRTIVHEIGHALLSAANADHCSEQNCIMCGVVNNWELRNFGAGTCTHVSGGAKDIRSKVHNTQIHKPLPPGLSSPTNGQTGVSLTPTLTWLASGGAASYTLQVSTTSAFTSYVINQSGITGTSYTIPSGKLSGGGKTYYWRVNAKNSAGTGGWSNAPGTQCFKTQ